MANAAIAKFSDLLNSMRDISARIDRNPVVDAAIPQGARVPSSDLRTNFSEAQYKNGFVWGYSKWGGQDRIVK